MRLNFTSDEYEELQGITDPVDAQVFLEARRDRIDMIYRDSKSRMHDQVCDMYKRRGYFSSVRHRLEPPRGTRPEVTPHDLSEFFSEHALVLIGMDEGYRIGSSGDHWSEPYGFGFNRFGWNADDGVDPLRFLCRAEDRVRLTPDFTSEEVFSPELIAAQQAEREQRAEQRQEIYRSTVLNLVDTLSVDSLRETDSTGEALIDRAINTARRNGVVIEDPNFVTRFLDSYNVADMQQVVRDRLASHTWYDNGVGMPGVIDHARRFTAIVASDKLSADLVAAFKKEAVEGGETVEVRNALREKAQQMIAVIDVLDQDPSPAAIVKVIKDLSAQIIGPPKKAFGRAPAVSKKQALSSGGYSAMIRYLRQIDTGFARERTSFDIEQAVTELQRKLEQKISSMVRQRALDEVSQRIGPDVVAGLQRSWEPLDRKLEQLGDDQPKAEDRRLLRRRASDIRESVGVGLGDSLQITELYHAWESSQDDALLKQIADKIRLDSRLARDVHISFAFDPRNSKHRYRLVTAARKIADNTERFRVVDYIDELKQGPVEVQASAEGESPTETRPTKQAASLRALKEMLQVLAA